jgi:hypothetical protein
MLWEIYMFPVRKPLILTIVQVKSVHDKDLLIIDFNLIDIKDVYNMILVYILIGSVIWWKESLPTSPILPIYTKRTIASLTVMVSNFTSINKTNNHLLNSDGQQFHKYQQNEQSPL